MRRLLIAMIVVLLMMTLAISSTYAWLTYVQRKSLATFEANEISITMTVNDQLMIDTLSFDDLAFIDYQNDLINDTNHVVDLMASSKILHVTSSANSPLAKHKISITNAQDGLIFVFIIEGLNIDETHMYHIDYHAYLSSIVSGLTTKEEQLLAISNHNQSVLDSLYTYVLSANDTLSFQIVAWGDYDALLEPDANLDVSFHLSIQIDSVSSKGELS